MNVRTNDGLVHVVHHDEDYGHYGATICGVDFGRFDMTRDQDALRVGVVTAQLVEAATTCLVCVVFSDDVTWRFSLSKSTK